ncbi:hypothetical protein MtrunA17_Chr5g0432791 [Medicago truncatula]|uniref:DUF7731 domain-containing protein n=1 Tax=Medicago truncatula TaxID=3880 RepID=G7K0U6_MEDTR|nr:hypothetical protein MTR_5g075520 [Medicago truncatula]RHN56752.1 hypothetical protein MtrunA17_Chr5g0432791 [Medicago truncatula]
MKNVNSNFLISIYVGILFFMLFNLANAESNEEYIRQPRRHVNLSPFDSWRSAYYCMMNHSNTCNLKSNNYTININGTLNVQDSDIHDFCTGGCYDHTLLVFKCIQDVKRDFHFATKAHISFVKNITMNACNELKGFDLLNYKDPNSATSLYGRMYMPLLSTLMTMAFIVTFGV